MEWKKDDASTLKNRFLRDELSTLDGNYAW